MPVETRYFRSDSWTVNGLTARRLQTTNSSSSSYLYTYRLGDFPAYFTVTSVAIRNANGTETIIGSNVAQMTRTTDGEGYQTASWSCPQTNLESQSALVVQIAVQVGSNSAVGSWITEQLSYARIDATTWNFVCFTNRIYDVDWEETYGAFYFGSSFYISRIENISFSTSTGGTVEASSFATSSSTASASALALLSAFSSSTSSLQATFTLSKTSQASSLASLSSLTTATANAVRSAQVFSTSASSTQAALSKTSFASSFVSSSATFSAVVASAAQALAEALLFCSSLASATLTLVKSAASQAEASASSSVQALLSRFVKSEAKGDLKTEARLSARFSASAEAQHYSTVQAKPNCSYSASSHLASTSSLTANAALKLFEIVLFSSKLRIRQPISSELKIKKVERLR